MPVLRQCSIPHCRNLVEKGRCLIHQHDPSSVRGTTSQRGYDSAWEKLRSAKLSTDPFCQIQTHCQGMLAVEVDHRVKIRNRPELRLEWDNLQSTCIPCHRAKTARERGQ